MVAQGKATETPGLSILKSMSEDPKSWLKNLKCNHGNPLGKCEKCQKEAESWEEREKRYAEEERIEAERQKAEKKAAEMDERQRNPEKWLKDYGVPKKFLSCSFENYQGGGKIKEILHTFPGQSILLSGTTGCGKTHLAIATLRKLIQEDSIPSVNTYINWSAVKNIKGAVFTTTPDLLLEIRSSFSKNSDEKELVDRYTKPSVLVLDDFGADNPTEWAVTTLYLIIDNRNKELMPTIVTTNLSMQEIENQYGARIASRLADMKIVNIKMPDWRKKR